METALDVGRGTGLLTLPLAERAGWTIGLDLSPAMLEKLTAKVARRGLTVELCEGSVLEVGFTDVQIQDRYDVFRLVTARRVEIA